MTHLLDVIIEHIPPAPAYEGKPQMQIMALDYSAYVGRIAIGRIFRGTLRQNMPISLVKKGGKVVRSRIKELQVFEGLGKKNVNEVLAGDICAVIGIENFDIGDTITDFDEPEALPEIEIDEPTINMLFTINNSPFFGKEGKFVTSRHLRDRLFKETEKNLALRVEETDSPDAYLVFGRGVLHLSVLIETMRREGYELQVGQPQIVIKEIDGQKCEPIEILYVDVPDEFSGAVIDLVTQRKGELLVMEPRTDMQHLEFRIPSRGLIGIRSTMLTATQGEATISHRFDAFEPYKGEVPERQMGVLIAKETGVATAYSIDKLQDRGIFFIEPGEMVYGGQVVGQHIRDNDLVINVCEEKKLTNMRASGSDKATRIAPATKFSLEECLEYINKDEYVEITPKSMRIRKIYLDENDRKRASKKV